MTEAQFDEKLRAEIVQIHANATNTWKDTLTWEDYFTAGAHFAKNLLMSNYPKRSGRPTNTMKFDENKYERAYRALNEIEHARMSPGMVKTIVLKAKQDLRGM